MKVEDIHMCGCLPQCHFRGSAMSILMHGTPYSPFTKEIYMSSVRRFSIFCHLNQS